MTSLTRIAYGSLVFRQGRWRPSWPNQAESSSSTGESVREPTAAGRTGLSARAQPYGRREMACYVDERGVASLCDESDKGCARAVQDVRLDQRQVGGRRRSARP